MAKQILNSLPVATGVLEVDGQKGPKVDLTNSYAPKSVETTIATQGQDITKIKDDLAKKLEETDLTGYAKTTDIPTDYVSDEDIKEYIKKADADKAYEPTVDWNAKLAPYAKTTDIPDDYLTDDDLEDYLKEEDADKKYATISALDDKADQSDLDDLSTEVEKKLDSDTAATTYAPISVTTTKADQTELDKTNAEVAKKADKTALADYYTKEELNGKLAAGVHYRGTVANYEALEALTDTAEAGDLYNLQDTGANYVFDETSKTWDKQSENIDLSGKADKTELNKVKEDVEKKADKEELKDYAKAETVTQLTTTVEGKLDKSEASTTYATISALDDKADQSDLDDLADEVEGKLDAADYHEAKVIIKDITLTGAGWNAKKQNISLAGFEEAVTIQATLKSKAQEDSFINDGIRLVDPESDSVLSFTCTADSISTDYPLTVIGFVMEKAA